MGQILIFEPITAPRGWIMGLATCEVSPLELFGLEAGEMNCRKKGEVLNFGLGTDPGSGKAAHSMSLMAQVWDLKPTQEGFTGNTDGPLHSCRI